RTVLPSNDHSLPSTARMSRRDFAPISSYQGHGFGTGRSAPTRVASSSGGKGARSTATAEPRACSSAASLRGRIRGYIPAAMSAQRSAVVWTPGEGPWETLSDAAEAAGRADVVVLFPGVEVFGDWLERLVAAAVSDTAIATASAMLSGERWAPSPVRSGGLEGAAAAVAERSLRRRPRISEPVAGCVVVRRTALDVAALGAGRRLAAGAGGAAWSAAGALAELGELCTGVGLA